jgi:hypothetical protein
VPYKAIRGKGLRPWKIINKKTGKQVGSSLTKEDAEASIRARNAAAHGALLGKGR